MSYNLKFSDAPGWAFQEKKHTKSNSSHTGPNCWKCQGTTKVKKKGTKKKAEQHKHKYVTCTVCSGKGYIPAKKKEIDGKFNPGVITRRSRVNSGNSSIGPLPYAMKNKSNQDDHYKEAVTLVENAINEHVQIPQEFNNPNYPTWLPNKGEELVNLVGNWRILQCVGSHRWTTDDLVEAYIASNEFLKCKSNEKYKYCDLGCGNASVLQMTLWKLLQFLKIECVGVEARSEAYNLAQRSIKFNIGNDNALCDVTLYNYDFRTLLEKHEEYREYFDFITGTPPYFKIEYDASNAIIRQGGMVSFRQLF